ncbi:protein FATTY ACID EXPORT 1, chloroplastic isoform X1 [Cryptomeria japonica]|uniref:protein FATTY ACID EXPORT 1, chloroplastic isoform X1 n=1 Tax=Cryptomeria japonica TaxID=3369 RepID=UPI0027DA5848|nr:protein FATTY ACID EXPORT 1, chloroplastic isoform X1 [Cryptomeria japonica]XP_059074047.1 protein FATTY ACID EXPORT 1, chloroplastic isoform X1 [Cryptomeria japonica]XP_059074048.1 protein FATTY ACID EXPORT 1, chloroplastic isoform X1 [Cryptomeria japonica]
MEKLMLSPSSCLGSIRVKKCAVTVAGNLPLRNSSNINRFNSQIALGFKGGRVPSQLGFVGERVNLRAGGWRNDALSRKFFAPAASREESGSTDLQVEGNVVEGPKDINGVHEAVTWNGESKGLENPDTEPFDSSRNSIEELDREVEEAKESLADISKEATGKEDDKSHITENEPVQEQRKAAKIHDFCFGIPYGGILVGLGLVGLLIGGGINSILCSITGASVLGLSLTSLKVWRQGKSCIPFIFRQAAFSLILLAGHLREFYYTRAAFPTGIIALISAFMLSFYTYVYAAGGNPPSKKLRAS